MTILLIGVNVFLLMILMTTLLNALTAPMVKNGPPPKSTPLVSLLVPARNEEHNIDRCLESLLQQDYPQIEILVLDDFSSDRTAERVKTWQDNDERLTLLSGTTLPPGWTGKNWACHQLAQQARGDYLIFTDADNTHSPDAVSKTIGWMQKLNLSLFSSFPQQITKTMAEKLIVPTFDNTVYSYLVLWFTYRLPFPSMAAANGQWLAFSRKGYQTIGGHEAVRDKIVEDTELARLAKRKKLRVITAAGRDAVFGRMYRSWREVYKGFSKNAFGLMGFQTVPFFILLTIMFIAYVLPFGLLFFPALWPWAAVAVLQNMLIRFILAVKYRQSVWVSVLLHPVAILLQIRIGLYSFWRYKAGSITWKDREVAFYDTTPAA